MSRVRRKALRDLEQRLLRVRRPMGPEILGRLERNASGQNLLAEMQAMLREEQKVLVAVLRSALGGG